MLRAPRVLHVATHGFFLPQLRSDNTTGRHSSSGVTVEDPLLRSGIVLAGANTLGRNSGEAANNVGSGWVTAEEIMSMNLQGTELVVLSACDTGLGDIQTGEGVLGLRRAFLYAGARSLLVSLYELPDAESERLIADFYESLKRGQGKLASLHDSQLSLLRAKAREIGAAHPFYWSGFVLVGDPN